MKQAKSDILYVFAGVNGAGKSIFYFNQLEFNSDFGKRINSDEIVKEIGNWKNSKDQNRAGRLAIKLRNKYIKDKITFNIETTLSGQSIINFIKKAKDNNYKIVLYYVGLDSVELSKQRVAIRKAKNGHSIDEAILERRYKQSFENLKKIIFVCDEIYFYDNSKHIEDENKQNFSNLDLIASKKDDALAIEKHSYANWFEPIKDLFKKDGWL